MLDSTELCTATRAAHSTRAQDPVTIARPRVQVINLLLLRDPRVPLEVLHHAHSIPTHWARPKHTPISPRRQVRLLPASRVNKTPLPDHRRNLRNSDQGPTATPHRPRTTTRISPYLRVAEHSSQAGHLLHLRVIRHLTQVKRQHLLVVTWHLSAPVQLRIKLLIQP